MLAKALMNLAYKRDRLKVVELNIIVQAISRETGCPPNKILNYIELEGRKRDDENWFEMADRVRDFAKFNGRDQPDPGYVWNEEAHRLEKRDDQ